MSRYIDVNKIKYTEYLNGDITVSKEEIDKIPTADVQEVVRCGLCKNYKLKNGTFWCVLHMTIMNNDDYCSYGVKRIWYENTNPALKVTTPPIPYGRS